MTAITSISTALAVLRADPRLMKVELGTPLPPMVALADDADVSNVITDTINGRMDLRAQYEASYGRARQQHSQAFEENVRHIALVETITANRGAFPPGDFALHTELPGGGSITTFIPSADGSTDYAFQAKVKAALQQAAPNDSGAKLDALSRINDVFLMNPSILNAGSLAYDAYEETASGYRSN